MRCKLQGSKVIIDNGCYRSQDINNYIILIYSSIPIYACTCRQGDSFRESGQARIQYILRKKKHRKLKIKSSWLMVAVVIGLGHEMRLLLLLMKTGAAEKSIKWFPGSKADITCATLIGTFLSSNTHTHTHHILLFSLCLHMYMYHTKLWWTPPSDNGSTPHVQGII